MDAIYIAIMFCIGMIIGGFAFGNNAFGVFGIIGTVVLSIVGITIRYQNEKKDVFDVQKATQQYINSLLESKSEKVDEDDVDNLLGDDVGYDEDDVDYLLGDDVVDDEDEEDEQWYEGFEFVDYGFADVEKPMYNMLGERISKTWFAKQQKRLCGFFPDFSFDKDKYQAFLAKKQRVGNLSIDDESRLIFPLIFGNFDCDIDLDKALLETQLLLVRVIKNKPTENLDAENDVYMKWLHDYAVTEMLLGTIYAYKNDDVRAAYHMMLSLRTKQLTLNTQYCDFIKYIFQKIQSFAIEDDSYTGCGFSVSNPMGSTGGTTLLANRAMQIIPEMEGDNGEVIIARWGSTGLFGHLQRLGASFDEKTQTMIDIYETILIDSNFQVKKVRFFFNGYFRFPGKNSIKIASGFKLKSYSLFRNVFNIIEK